VRGGRAPAHQARGANRQARDRTDRLQHVEAWNCDQDQARRDHQKPSTARFVLPRPLEDRLHGKREEPRKHHFEGHKAGQDIGQVGPDRKRDFDCPAKHVARRAEQSEQSKDRQIHSRTRQEQDQGVPASSPRKQQDKREEKQVSGSLLEQDGHPDQETRRDHPAPTQQDRDRKGERGHDHRGPHGISIGNEEADQKERRGECSHDRRRLPGLAQEEHVGEQRRRCGEKANDESARPEGQERERQQPHESRSVLKLDVAVHHQPAGPEIPGRRHFRPGGSPQAERKREVDGESREGKDIQPATREARLGDQRGRCRALFGNRPSHSRPFTEAPYSSTRHPGSCATRDGICSRRNGRPDATGASWAGRSASSTPRGACGCLS
jgi:hypothetical protein